MTDSLDSRVREMLERELPCLHPHRGQNWCATKDSDIRGPCVHCHLRPALTAAVLKLARGLVADHDRIEGEQFEAHVACCDSARATARRDALLEAAKAGDAWVHSLVTSERRVLRRHRRSSVTRKGARMTNPKPSAAAMAKARELMELALSTKHFTGCPAVYGHECDCNEVGTALALDGFTVKQTAEIARLREALTDFAEHGLRADLNPTHEFGDTWEKSEVFWHGYAKRMDDSVRQRARAALAGSQRNGHHE